MRAYPHIVQKQVLDIEVHAQVDAEDLQDRFSDIYRRKVIPVIEEVCATFADAHTTIRLDELTLDLGDIFLDEFDEAFADRVRAALYSALHEAIARESRRRSDAISILPQGLERLELLDTFLANGRYPWWAGKSADYPEEQIRDLLELQPEFLKRWLQNIRGDADKYHRFLLQFPSTLQRKLGALVGESAEIASSSRSKNTILPDRQEAAAPARTAIAQLGSFLRSGHFRRSEYGSPDALLLACIAEAPEEVIAYLQEIARARALRRRVIQALDSESLLAILRMLEPAHAPMLEAFYLEMVEVVTEDPPEHVAEAEVRDMTMEVILSYLLSQRGTQFNELIFVRQMIRQLAREHRMDYEVFLMLLADSARALLARNFVPRTRLLTILLALQEDQLAELPVPGPEIAEISRQDWQIALTYLETGEWPESGPDQAPRERWLLALLERRPPRLVLALRQLLAKAVDGQQLPRRHSGQLIAAVLSAAAPAFTFPARQLLGALGQTTADLRLSAFQADRFEALLWHATADFYRQSPDHLDPGKYMLALLPVAAKALNLPVPAYVQLLQARLRRPAAYSSAFRLALQAALQQAPEWGATAGSQTAELAEILALALAETGPGLDLARVEPLLQAAAPRDPGRYTALADDLTRTLLHHRKGSVGVREAQALVWQAILATLAAGYEITASPQVFLQQVLRRLARLSEIGFPTLVHGMARAIQEKLLAGKEFSRDFQVGISRLEHEISGITPTGELDLAQPGAPRELLRSSFKATELPVWLRRLPRGRAVDLWLGLVRQFLTEASRGLQAMQAVQLAWLLDFLGEAGVQRLIGLLYPGQFAGADKLTELVQPAAAQVWRPATAGPADRFAAISQLLLNGPLARGLKPEALESALRKWLRPGDPAAVLLLKGLLREASARQRLLAYLPAEAVSWLLQQLLPEDEADFSVLVLAFRQLGIQQGWLSMSDQAFAARVWAELLVLAAGQQVRRLDRAQLFALLFRAYGPEADAEAEVWERDVLLDVLPARAAREVDLLLEMTALRGRGAGADPHAATREWLRYFLQYGSFPADCSWEDAATFAKAWQALLDAHPRQLERLLAAFGWQNENIHRLLALLPGDLRLPAGISLAGSDSKTIHSRALTDWLDVFWVRSRAPWWSGEVFDADRMAAEIASKVLKAVSDAAAEALSAWLRHTSRWPLFIALFRDERLLEQVLQALFPALYQRFADLRSDFLKVLSRLKGFSLSADIPAALVWRAFLRELEEKGPDAVNFDTIIIRSLRELAPVAGSEYQAFFLQNVDGARASALTPYIYSSDLLNQLEQIASADAQDKKAASPPQSVFPENSAPKSTEARFKDFYQRLEKGEWPAPSSSSKKSGPDATWKKLGEEEDGEPMFVGNAGLVLMWPFYGQFFKRLGLREGKDLVDDAAREKAVHILQYLVTGNCEHPEYELILNKALCGIPLEKPIARFVELTVEEKEECEDLLRSVIANWTALGATKPDTFRETFLQREGALFASTKGWKLRVAGTPYDMLIKQLPWSISLIRTTWVQKPIFVEWKPS